MPLLNPNVVSGDSLLLKSLLLNTSKIGSKYTEEHKAFLAKYADPCVLDKIKGLSTADMCLEVARYYSYAHEVRFWELVKANIDKFKAKSKPEASTGTSPKQEEDHQPKEEEEKEEETTAVITKEAKKEANQLKHKNAQFYNTFAAADEVKDFEEEVESIHVGHIRANTSVTANAKKYITTCGIATGRREDAIGVLMMPTQGKDKLDYESALKACIVAATVGQDTFVNTTKMVAGQLISEGSLQEGVQLLTIIGKGFEGCKHLISQGKWTQAAWLASLLLEGPERASVLSMWATYLVESGLTTKAIEVLLGLGDFHQVLFLLNGAKDWELAYMLVLSLEEAGVVVETGNVNDPVALSLDPICTSTRRLSVSANLPPVHLLVNLVKESYAQYLNSVIGLKEFSE